MKKRVLITGANGMLGGTLVNLFQDRYEIYATGTQPNGLSFFNNYKPYDLRSNSYEDLLKWSDPAVIIHCAALTNGNHCQQNPMEAFQVNGLPSRTFSESIKPETKIIYISTDAVFSSQIHMASEKDCTSPENVYGKSKEIGEFFLRNSEVDYTIIRTTIVGLNRDPAKKGFVEWILNSAENNNQISLFDDVFFSPISIYDLAEQIEIIFNSGPKFSKKILHIAGKSPCTKYEFGIKLLQRLNLPVDRVEKGSINDMEGRAKRSTDQSLDCSYYESLAETDLPDLEKTVEKIKANYKDYEKH